MDAWAIHDGKLLLIQVKGRHERVSIHVAEKTLKVERLLGYKKKGKWVFEPVK